VTVAPVFKDLQKLVSAQQQEKARNDLYDRLINKPFWIWDKEELIYESLIAAASVIFTQSGIISTTAELPTFQLKKERLTGRVRVCLRCSSGCWNWLYKSP
jgi:hypothetical protein